VIWPAGHRWSETLKPIVGTDWCMHAHVGFLARGRVSGEYADGCTFSFAAPQVVVIEPEHDAWVEGDEDAVMIQFDYESDTAQRFGLPERHAHG
jgi:streptogramin lyase